jgi:hypothetical protein
LIADDDVVVVVVVVVVVGCSLCFLSKPASERSVRASPLVSVVLARAESALEGPVELIVELSWKEGF